MIKYKYKNMNYFISQESEIVRVISIKEKDFPEKNTYFELNLRFTRHKNEIFKTKREAIIRIIEDLTIKMFKAISQLRKPDEY